MSVIEKQKPMFIFMAVECTAWSIMQNASDPEYRRKKQPKALPMVEFCSAVAKYQIDQIMEGFSLMIIQQLPASGTLEASPAC